VNGSVRPARFIIAIAGALLIAYAVIWSQLGSVDVGRSDFTSFYLGGSLLREGQGADLYNEAIQAPLHSRLIAPDAEASLPFVNSPIAAALVVPVTFLDLHLAYRLWGIVELVVLLVAVVIAVRSATWPRGIAPLWKISAGAAAMASMGTWTVLVQAQWTPLVALGLALAHRDWKNGHHARGAAVLVITAGMVKPHLALGLIAFLLGWRNRSAILGGLAGAVALAIASFALVGPHGIAGFVSIVAGSTGRWDLRNMLSFVGVAGAFFGNGVGAHILGALGSLVACAVAAWLGILVHRDLSRIDVALAGAAVLSLLAAPHAYSHDLVMLAPAFVWGAAGAAMRSFAPDRRATLTPLAAVFGTWALISAAAYTDFSDNAALPPGQLAAWALGLAAVLACVASRRSAGVRSATAHVRSPTTFAAT
jgi:hypothetical protein